MPQQTAAEAASTESGASFAEAHRKLLADSSIQFEMAPFKQPEPPAWLLWLFEFLAGAGPVVQILFWAGVAALAIYLVYLVAMRVSGGEWPWRRNGGAPAEEESWQPEEMPARALLREADALAAAGRFADAAHLLLFRSIEEIEARRPRLVRPALTSRDIANAPQLPGEARSAFWKIVAMVETSLFGGRDLGEGDWRECRQAYEEFAFAGAWR